MGTAEIDDESVVDNAMADDVTVSVVHERIGRAKHDRIGRWHSDPAFSGALYTFRRTTGGGHVRLSALNQED